MVESGYRDTTALEKIEGMSARINIIQGGARAGKTTAMLIHLCDLSFEVRNKIISIVTDSYPNLERGAIRDWERLLARTNREAYFIRNRVKHTWENRITGTLIEFFSAEAEDVLGAGRDYLFVNEANRVEYRVFDQLMLRTTERAWLDFNPVNEFWAHTEIMQKRTDWEFLKLTYRDNEGIPPAVLGDLLQHRGDGTNNWWRVYGEGEIGALEGNVYEGWIAEEVWPREQKGEEHEGAEKRNEAVLEGKRDEAELEASTRPQLVLKRYGVDFGYNDPTVIIAVYEDESRTDVMKPPIYLKQCLYETHLTSDKIAKYAKELNDHEPALFVCDNARPEMIRDLVRAGVEAVPCDKTAGGKLGGKRYNINLVAEREVHYLKSDKELEREYLTYAWRTQKSTGERLDVPEDGGDHAMDAIAYAVRDMERKAVKYGGVRFGVR